MKKLSPKEQAELQENLRKINATANRDLAKNINKSVIKSVRGTMLGAGLGLAGGLYFKKPIWLSIGIGAVLGRLLISKM